MFTLQLTLKYKKETFKYKYYFITFMKTIKTIKDVDEDTWGELKLISKKNKMKMGKTIRLLIHNYKNRSNLWDEILHHEKILSDEEAEAILKDIKELRKEKGFRE